MAVHPHAACGIFYYINNHYFDFLSEIAQDVYTETGSYFAVASIFCFLKRNRLSLKKVCLIFSALDSVLHEF